MMASWILVLLATLAMPVANSHELAKQVCSKDNSVFDVSYNAANLVFGGNIGVRNPLYGNIGCGKPSFTSMQWVEAIRFSLNYLNNFNGGNGYLPGVTFGMRLYDNCHSPTNALRQLQEMFPQSTTYQPYCSDTSNKAMLGTLGPFFSSVSEKFVSYAKDIPAVVMSPSAMATSLSDTHKYPTFFRTVPTIGVQMRAIASLLSDLHWEKVIAVHTDSLYGMNSLKELVLAAKDFDLCMSQAVKVPYSGSVAEYQRIFQGIGSNDFVAGVILADDHHARLILESMQQIPGLQQIHWVLIDVSRDTPISPTTLRQMKGAFTVMPRSVDIEQFKNYFVSLKENPAAVNDNPWFQDWYEEAYQCSLTPGSPNQCVLKNRATLLNDFQQSPYVMTTIKAIFAYAEAFKTLCPSGSGVCEAGLRATSQDIQNALKSMDFTFPASIMGGALTGERIQFDAKGDLSTGGFTVFQYNDIGGTFSFKEVGEYKNGLTTLTGNTRYYNAIRSNQAQAPTLRCADSGCNSCLLPPQPVHYEYTPGDLVIGSLIHAHSHGESLFNCGPFLEKRLTSLVAVQWAIDEYKRKNPNNLRGVALGSLVADVCPNGAAAAGFLKDLFSTSSTVKDDMGLTVSSRRNIVGFVDDTDNMMAQTISSILSQYKYPEIQTGATALVMGSDRMHPYYSRAIPDEGIYMKALVSLLSAKKWNHVQVAVEKNPMHSMMAQKFKAFAARHGICVVSTSHFEDGASQVLSELLSEQNAFVVVTFARAEHVKALFDEVKSTGNKGNIQVVSGTSEWATDPRYFDTTTSEPEYTITMALRRSQNTDFENYLRGLTHEQISMNPFLTSLFEMSNKCSLVTSTRGMYSRICSNADTFAPYQGNAPYTIQAIYNIADKLHEILVETCGSQNYYGVCVEFSKLHDLSERLSEKLKNSPGIVNGEGSTDIVYYVISNGQYQEFGDYDTSEQHINNLQSSSLLNSKFNRQTTCPDACLDCRYLYTYKSVVYQPGDFIIAGAFSTSSAGPESLQPFVCGDVKTVNGPLYTLAMMYALEKVNSNQAPVSAKGVKIGGVALDYCYSTERLKLMVSDMYSGFLHESMDVDETKIMSWLIGGSGASREGAMILNPLGIPIISPDATSEDVLKDFSNFYRTTQGDATVSSALIKIAKQLGFRYIQIVHSASVYGKNAKDALVRIGQTEGICVTQTLEFGDQSQASDIVDQVMKKDTHVVILIMSTSSTTSMFQAITANQQASQSLVVMLPEPFTQVVEAYGMDMAYPPIAVSLRHTALSGFQAYLDSNPVDNPIFANYYMKMNRCNLEGHHWYDTKCSYPLSPITNNPQYVDSIYDLTTINAVYASVDALDRTIKEYCDPDYTEPCAEYLSAPDKHKVFAKNLQYASFIDESSNQFRFLQREGNVAFNILQYNRNRVQQVEVGSYAGISLNLGSDFASNYQDVSSDCGTPCLECINTGLNFSLTPGDIYLGGMFDVHHKSYNPFICGRISTLHGFLLQEAFHYALSQVNSNEGQFKDILNGVKLGGVGLDACGSRVRGGQLVSNINNHLTTLSKDAVVVDPEEIDVYIGSYDSSTTQYLARILNDLEIPQISYAAGSTIFSDERRYPHFFRTVPSNVHQARAILAYLNKKNIRYIQILYSGNTYGRSGQEELVKMAEEYKICIAQSVEYPDLGIASLERSKAAVSELVEKPSANTVVTFLGTSYINSVLKAVGLSDRARGKLRFVGSDVWADNKEAIDGAGTNPVDSITLKLDADDVVPFENYINSKTLSNSADNPWFEEYYQEIHNCYTTPGNPYGYTRPCAQSLTSIITSVRYQQDPNVISVMNAVYASAFAIHKTLTDLCGVGYQSVCQAYRNNMNRRDLITHNLDDVEFKDPTGSDFRFSDREALLNFRLNAIESGALQGINYRQIGTYNSKDMKLELPAEYTPFRPWESGCDREDACSECPAIRDSSIRYAFYQSDNVPYNDAPVIVGFFDIHKQGVDPYRCGELNQAGYQQFLSFFYGVKKHFASQIQGEPGNGAYRGIRLLAVDTCSNPVRIDQDLFGLLQGTGLCNTDFILPNGVSISSDNIGSVIVSGNMNTLAVSRLLEPAGITYLSPNAKSPLLDNKMYLGRTTLPISGKMRFLAHLASVMDWSYMDVMYEETEMGYYPFHSLQKFALSSQLCLGEMVAFGESSTNQDMERYLSALNGRRGSRVVVLLGSKDFFSRVLTAAGDLHIAEDYIWVLGTPEELDEDYVESITPIDTHVRFISLSTVHNTVPGFRDFVRNTKYSPGAANLNDEDIPREWYEEFYQMMNDCSWSNANKVINVGKPACTFPHVDMTHYEEDHYILNTVLATFAASEGLHQSLVQDISLATGKNLGEKRKMIKDNIMAANMKVSALGVRNDDSFELNEYRWWDCQFIINFWNVEDQDADKHTWTLSDLPARDTVEDLKQRLNVSSMCLESERQGYCGCDYRTAFTAAIVDAPDYVPSSHRNYYKYDDDGDRVYDWPIWAIAIAVLTGIGLFITLILFLILLCAYPRKGGTSVLGYLMIIGIMGIYAINFAFFVSATDTVCGIRRFLMGVVYTICFAPLLLKAVDNWRYGHVEYAQRKYSGISSACALFMCAIGVVLIQCIIPIMWLILEHPKAHAWYYGHDAQNDNDWCSPADDYDLGMVLSFSFVVFVVFMTGIFAALSYETKSNNYESRWILLASVATAGCFLVWMIVTTNAKGVYRDPTVTIANFANATILMLTVPLRKTVLMVQAKRYKDDDKSEQDKNPYADMYSESYVNPGYELSDYDQVFMEKPSEF